MWGLAGDLAGPAALAASPDEMSDYRLLRPRDYDWVAAEQSDIDFQTTRLVADDLEFFRASKERQTCLDLQLRLRFGGAQCARSASPG